MKSLLQDPEFRQKCGHARVIRWCDMVLSALKLFALASALVTAAGAAGAATIDDVGPTIFGSNGSTTVTIKDDDLRPNGVGVVAGGFEVKVSAGTLGDTALDLATSFTAWCLDIGINVKFPSDYAITTNPFAPTFTLSSQQKADIRALVNTGYDPLLLGGAAYSAGFQLALWEIVNEDNVGPYDIYNGSFKSPNRSGTADDDARTAATNLLAGLTTFPGTGPWRVIYLESQDATRPRGRDSQHLMTVAAVPLPAAGFLLLAALGGLAVMRRRVA